MTPVRYAAIVADAWQRFRRDADLLVRIAGPFFFLPALALEWLVPPPPVPAEGGGGTEADALAWADALSAWAQAHGGWYLLSYAVQVLGVGAVLALYLHRPEPDVRGALLRAARLWPRLVLAALLVAVPAGAGLLLWIVPGVYVLGRAMASAPVLVAEAPTGAAAAVARSLRLTRGAGLPMAGLAGTALLLGYVGGAPFAAVGARAAAAHQPVLAAVAGLGSAVVGSAAALANALFAACAYRALVARQGV